MVTKSQSSMVKSLSVLIIMFVTISSWAQDEMFFILATQGAKEPTVLTFYTPDSWVCPQGVTEIYVECIGGGGGGGNATTSNGHKGGGGAGGTFAAATVSVTPGVLYAVVPGAGASGGNTLYPNPGGDSWFGILYGDLQERYVCANGGETARLANSASTTGATATTNRAIGDIIRIGGNGANASTERTGSGGGGSGRTNSGTNATTSAAGIGNSPGGNGGLGITSMGDGIAGSNFGGGGSGGFKNNTLARAGGRGGDGVVIIYY